VRQGPLSLSADELQAVYVSGESQPRELQARGHVKIHEGTRRARCEEARYDRSAQQIVCRGNPAELWDNEDRLAGGAIAFDLARKTVRVESGTEVKIERELSAEDLAEVGAPIPRWSSACAARDRSRSPPRRSRRAIPGETERRIRFGGGVVLKQGDIELSARELEAIYPPRATQPERLIARDDVTLREGQREAHCQLAEYRLAERHLVCEGAAVLRDGDDHLEGERIAFDFGAQMVDASGRTRLFVQSLRREDVR
jgi:lipopolysaccharide export system protein LptA